MKKPITKSTATISIATLVVVFVVALGLILANNYKHNQALPKSTPITNAEITVANRLTNAVTIDRPYLIDSIDSLKQQLKISALTGFDPTNQVLAGVVLTGKPNAGYGVVIDSTATLNNQVLINYRVVHPEEGKSYASVITYPKLFITFNRTDLPNFSPVNFVFTNVTDGATQTISKVLGAQ